MTGMDVMRQCRRYNEDVERLKLRQQMALDAATRITASMSGVGGHSSGASDKAGRYARVSMEVEAALSARNVMYEMELEAADEILNSLSLEASDTMYNRMVRGLTVRQTAATMHKSVSTVRGLYTRACGILEGRVVGLSVIPAYREAMERYRANGGPLSDWFCRRLDTGVPL